MSRRALVIGISGQDGAYLAKYLIDKGYSVYGTSRNPAVQEFSGLVHTGVRASVVIVDYPVNDYTSIQNVISDVDPHEIYNLSGQTSVALSFSTPLETYESNTTNALHWLEAIRLSNRPVRYYNASTSECFGETQNGPADEETEFCPKSPYAAAKVFTHLATRFYRKIYGLYCCSGILFNHESPLRPKHFVTQKIVAAAVDIANGKQNILSLGNLDVQRDWGWAPEYVIAMHAMLQEEEPGDFVIATGVSHTLRELVEIVFDLVGLDWKEHVVSSDSHCRPSDIWVSQANPNKAQAKLGWSAKYDLRQVLQYMIDVRATNWS